MRQLQLRNSTAHQDQVFVVAVDPDRVALQAFDSRSRLSCRARSRLTLFSRTVSSTRLQPEGPRRGERLPDQTLADALPPEFRQQAHAENAAMGINRPWLRHDIAPADDFAARHRDQLRITLFDIVENERPGRFERRRFQKRTDSAAPARRNRGLDESFRYGLALSEQFRPQPSSRQRVDPAPRGTAGKQLSWMRPSDNGLI